MRIFKLLIIALLLPYLSCRPGSGPDADLHLVSQDTLLSWVSTGRFPKPKEVLIVDENGNEVPKETLYEMEEPRDVRRDYYQNNEGEIRKIVISPAAEADRLFFDKMTNLEKRNRPQITKEIVNIVPVKCSEKKKLLEKVIRRDQRNRSRGVEYIDDELDQKNMEILLSLFEKCGDTFLNDLEPEHGTAIFLTLQHAHQVWRKSFKDKLIEGRALGIITSEQIALLTDRTLMDDNKPQIYGTQLVDGKLYRVDNMDSVAIRRQQLGLESLSDYLVSFSGID